MKKKMDTISGAQLKLLTEQVKSFRIAQQEQQEKRKPKWVQIPRKDPKASAFLVDSNLLGSSSLLTMFGQKVGINFFEMLRDLKGKREF